MGTDGEALTGDPRGLGARADVLYESPRCRVMRLFLPDGSVISKEPLGRDASGRLRHEVAILERLSGVAGVAQLAAVPARPGAILLVDVGGVGLAETAMPWGVGEAVGLALGLARAVAGMHQRGVTHLDINPANVVVSGSPRAPCLIDFGSATTIAASCSRRRFRRAPTR
jgi:hypothetical protein